jgi:hypothetical protein
MQVLAVGCSEGNDATAWHTVIKRPRIQNFLSGYPSYEAVECEWAPKQGRSGGGLYTIDGYVAGVCNFAEPQGNNGLYATPRSIYSLLDRNHLSALYAPASRPSGPMLADRRRGAPSRRHLDERAPVARSQSPDGDEPDRSHASARNGDVMIPSPGLLGITDPIAAQAEAMPQPASGTTRRTGWHSTPDASAPAGPRRPDRAGPADVNLEPSADNDRSDGLAAEPRTFENEESAEADDPGPASNPISAKTRWRRVKAVPADPAPATRQSG